MAALIEGPPRRLSQALVGRPPSMRYSHAAASSPYGARECLASSSSITHPLNAALRARSLHSISGYATQRDVLTIPTHGERAGGSSVRRCASDCAVINLGLSDSEERLLPAESGEQCKSVCQRGRARGRNGAIVSAEAARWDGHSCHRGVSRRTRMYARSRTATRGQN